MMKLFVGLSVFFIIVGAGIFYAQNPQWFSQSNSNVDTTQNVDQSEASAVQNNQEKLQTSDPESSQIQNGIGKINPLGAQFKTISRGDLKTLIESGNSGTCVIALKQSATPAGSTSYTTYFTNGKIRTDIVINVTGKTIITHALIDNTYSYTWNDGARSGLWETLAIDTKLEKAIGESQKNLSDAEADKLISIQCKSWNVDHSFFMKPNITFYDSSDPDALKKVLQENMSSYGIDSIEYKKSICKLCDALGTESQKEQCRIEAKCR